MKNFWYTSQIMNLVLVVLLVWISTLLNASSAVGMLFINCVQIGEIREINVLAANNSTGCGLIRCERPFCKKVGLDFHFGS